MKKLISILMALLLVFSIMPVASAQEETAETEAEEIEGNPGITPDSALHGIDRALERIRYAMTIGSKNKAAYGLKIAEERLLEAQAMAKAKKLDAFEKAKNNYGLALGKVKKDLANVVSDDPEEELDDDTELETEIEEHEEKLNKLITLIDIKILGTLTEEQREKLKSLLESFENENEDLKVKVNEKRLKAIVKYKTKLEKTDEEANEKLLELRKKHKLIEIMRDNIEHQIERLEKKIAKLEELTDKAEEKGKDVSLMRQRLEEAKSIVEEIKQKVEDKNLEKVKELIHKANQLLNFREVFVALEAEPGKVKEKLQELEQKRIEKKAEIQEKLQEIKEKRLAKKESKEVEETEEEEEGEEETEETEEE